MKKLTYQEEARIKERFLTYLGNFIKTKRDKKNISQVTLANCLNITDSALSKYESGTRDMPVSYLPLISTYCDFSLTEYFDVSMAKELSDTFSSLVEITAKKYQRKNELACEPRKRLTGRIYETDGIEIIEPVGSDRKKIKTRKQQFLDGEVEMKDITPLSENEFIEYIKSAEFTEEKLSLLSAAKSFLLYIGDEPRKETFKSAMADFVINELVIEQIKTDTGHSKRMYAYYKKLMDYYKNSPHNSQESIIENRYVPNENVSFENEDAILDLFRANSCGEK